MAEIEDWLGEETWERTSERDTELLTEFGGRVCYLSFGGGQGRKDTGAYLANIIEQGHGSVLEHVSWTLLIEGVSRSFSHELVRHRAGVAISQLSQRYVASPTFVRPPLIAPGTVEDDLWREMTEEADTNYHRLLGILDVKMREHFPDLAPRDRRKRVREAARSALPNCTETKIVFTANARALRHIIEYRGSIHADAEMRLFAIRLLRLMQQESPGLFGDYKIMLTAHGEEIALTDHAKV